jgi:DNA modification methylase
MMNQFVGSYRESCCVKKMPVLEFLTARVNKIMQSRDCYILNDTILEKFDPCDARVVSLSSAQKEYNILARLLIGSF